MHYCDIIKAVYKLSNTSVYNVGIQLSLFKRFVSMRVRLLVEGLKIEKSTESSPLQFELVHEKGRLPTPFFVIASLKISRFVTIEISDKNPRKADFRRLGIPANATSHSYYGRYSCDAVIISCIVEINHSIYRRLL